MRIAFLLTATYALRPDLGRHVAASHDARAVREKLSLPGFDFAVVDVPLVFDFDDWIARSLREQAIKPDDPVVAYVSAHSHLDDAGEVSLEVDQSQDAASLSGRRRVPFARLRSAMTLAGVRGAVMVLDLVFAGQPDSVEASEHVAAVRRVFAPELSGFSVFCSVRSAQASGVDRGDPSPFTALWLRALDSPQARNPAGAVVVTRVIDQMREDTDLYTDVPCFSLMAGRRDVALFSLVAASERTSVPPPSIRPSAPPSSQPASPIGFIAAAEAYFARGQHEAAMDEFKKALLLLGEERSSRRAEIYVRLGDIKTAQGRRREAILNHRKALAIQSTNVVALRSVADLLRAEGDFAEAIAQRRLLLEECRDEASRFEVLLALAEDSDKGRDAKGAQAALESARLLRPEDTAVLARLAQSYDASHAWSKVVEIKVAIALLKAQPEEVARSLVAAADFARERAGDDQRALEVYAQALDADPLGARAFDAIREILERRLDHDALDRALLAQAARLERAGVEAAQAAVWRELSTLRRERRADLQGAIEALDRCVEIIPGDVEARASLAELLESAGELQAAAMSHEIAAWHAPGRAETYRALFRLAQKMARTDRAFLAAAALSHLGEADLDEQMCFEQYRPAGPVRPTRSLDEKAWEELYPAAHDAHVRTILRVVAPAAIGFKLARLRQQSLLPSLDPASRQDPETSTVSLTRTFVWASRVLDVPLPEIYAADEVPGGIAAVPAETPTAVVGRSVLSGRSLTELAFLVGRDLTYYRPEHYVLVMYSTKPELMALFLAAVRQARPELPVPEASRAEVHELAAYLKEHVAEDARRQLELAVDHFEEAGGRIKLVAWARSIELAATRAGLLACGDLEVAASILDKDDRPIDELTAADRMNDLLPFSVSEGYAKLRERLGVAVG
jgi:tetratricopeptide (TPR) repeat protein